MSFDPTGGNPFIGLLIVLAAAAVYLLPTLIAWRRHHHQWLPILLVNLVFGWAFGIGWVIALVWAVSFTPPRQPQADARGGLGPGLGEDHPR